MCSLNGICSTHPILCVFFYSPSCLVTQVLYCRGWPTSLVLLLRVQVSQLPLALRRHPPLRLHDLLRFVRAARGLVALGGVEVVQVVAGWPLRAVEVARVWAGGGALRHSAV